jgi:hypothetical protein
MKKITPFLLSTEGGCQINSNKRERIYRLENSVQITSVGSNSVELEIQLSSARHYRYVWRLSGNEILYIYQMN